MKQAVNQQRRRFLKTMGGAAVASCAGLVVGGCQGAGRADLERSGRPLDAVKGLDDKLSAILYYASLAANGHNSQPWFVKTVNPNEWIIGVDPERRLGSIDPHHIVALQSIGAFSENLSVAATTFGYEAEMDVVAAAPTDEEIIKVSLRKRVASDYPLKRITSRMTPKHGFRNSEIKSVDVKALSAAAGGRLFYFPRGSDHAKCIREGAVETFRTQVFRDEAQRESVKWFRPNDAEARKFRDGLSAEGMEVRGILGWYFRNFVSRQDMMKASFRKKSVDHMAGLAKEGGGWFVMTSKENSVADSVEAGRRFESMALLARERGLGIHPMTQWLEEETGLKKIANNHKPDVVESAFVPQMVIRVGYLDTYPDPVSFRRPPGWFVRT